jgi:hypothetical protein
MIETTIKNVKSDGQGFFVKRFGTSAITNQWSIIHDSHVFD